MNFAVIVLHLHVLLYSQVHHDNFQLTDMDNLKYFAGIGEFENLENCDGDVNYCYAMHIFSFFYSII